MSENIEKTTNGIGAVRDDFDFWKNSTDFLKSIIDSDVTEKQLAEHIKERGFNDNEMRLFRECLVRVYEINILEISQNKTEETNDQFDFWVDANTFLKTIIDADIIKNKVAEHIKEFSFNNNEIRMFKEYSVKAFDMIPMFSYLKYNLQ